MHKKFINSKRFHLGGESCASRGRSGEGPILDQGCQQSCRKQHKKAAQRSGPETETAQKVKGLVPRGIAAVLTVRASEVRQNLSKQLRKPRSFVTRFLFSRCLCGSASLTFRQTLYELCSLHA